MHKKFEINQTKIKGGCQSERKVVSHDSKSDLPLAGPLQISSASQYRVLLLKMTSMGVKLRSIMIGSVAEE